MADVKSVTSTPSAESDPIGGVPSPAQIDSRRAQQLLERALVLAERGDVPAAVLACRQAITLNPTAPQGFSMLGLLLERAGDTLGAITAYEKVLQIDPGSLLERESLGRLRAAVAQHRTARDLFNFDESELFDERAEYESSTLGESELNGSGSTPSPDIAASEAAAHNGASRQNISAAAAAQAAIDAAITRAGHVSVSDSPAPNQAASPAAVVIHPVAGSTPASPAPAPSPAATSAQPAFPGGRMGRVAPASEEDVEPATVWQRLMARPSYYFRGAPLAATTAVSLLFLFWAHQYAASRAIALVPAPTSTPVTDTTSRPPSSTPDAASATKAADTASTAANTNTTTSGGVPVNPNAGTSNPALPAGSAANPPVANTPAMTSVPASGTSSTSAAQTPEMPRPAPADGGATNNPNSGASPDASSPTQAATGNAGGGGNTGATGGGPSGGGPLSPSGSSDRDFTRVSPGGGRTAPPPRAEARAAREERDATSGNSDAIAAATRAIEAGGGDTALRYQRRAQLYLDSGDNIRAINDFQTAISAYNDMIARGDRVALARAGIQASQRGIQIARARAGR